ncbi:hypothetical protein N7G274_007746 [Stereocaulon virgatum]|uniref:Uncharacterized protein n=1 Tax=Stereocaulon virgatum TaxID=373712 RepID=A0ABR4A1W4_9LECA
MQRTESNRPFCADGSRPMVFNPLENASARLSGLLVDQITKKSSSSMSLYIKSRFAKEVFDCYSEWRQLCSSSRRLDRDDANLHFARLVTNDIYGEWTTDGRTRIRRCSNEQFRQYELIFNDLQEPSGQNSQSEHSNVLLNNLLTACAGRFLFLTAVGYAGLGPHELQVGDSLYVLAGGHKLYVLRPVLGATRSQTFNLIGDCYVQGIMDGEAVEGRDDDFHDVFMG